MIQNTFCHLAGIGAVSEQKIWDAGIHRWDDLEKPGVDLPPKRLERIRALLADSQREYENGNPNYFADLLPSNQHWRLYGDYKDAAAYLDIETTGLEPSDHITTIALYDGRDIRHYVRGQNLDDFKKDIQKYKVIVTYNGKTFDVPVIESELGIKIGQAHLDLRYSLKSLGYGGGLKQCERTLGYDRGKLKSVDGYMAVLLWREYRKTRDQRVLDTLLAYNIEDVLSLEALSKFVYNTKLKCTPFYDRRRMPADPVAPANPFDADQGVLDRLNRRFF